jgi:hypothetical protein
MMPNPNSNLIRSIISVGQTVLPLLGPQGAAAAGAVAAIQRLLTDARGIADTPTDRNQLDALLQDLQARVNEHAQRTADNLRGR